MQLSNAVSISREMQKKSNTCKIQTSQNNILRKITNSPAYISNLTLHTDLKIKTIYVEAVTFYKIFYSRLSSHINPLISNIATWESPKKTQKELASKPI